MNLLNTVSFDELCSGLIAAASRGYANICSLILRTDSQTSAYVDPQQWNALRSAACNNHDNVVELLIQNGSKLFIAKKKEKHININHKINFNDRMIELFQLAQNELNSLIHTNEIF